MPIAQPVSPRLVPDELTLELYRKMLAVFYVQERMKIFVRQGKCSFHGAPAAASSRPEASRVRASRN